jgi:hypothetical protein
MFKRTKLLIIFGSANSFPPSPPVHDLYYTDRAGNIYTDRNGEPYSPRSSAADHYYTARDGAYYTDRNTEMYQSVATEINRMKN